MSVGERRRDEETRRSRSAVLVPAAQEVDSAGIDCDLDAGGRIAVVFGHGVFIRGRRLAIHVRGSAIPGEFEAAGLAPPKAGGAWLGFSPLDELRDVSQERLPVVGGQQRQIEL